MYCCWNRIRISRWTGTAVTPRLMLKILSEVNPEYEVVVQDRSIGMPLVLIQQQQTHALWRELKLARGSSANQVKPVRVLDVPMKQKFFFGLLEEGQEVPRWNFGYKEKAAEPGRDNKQGKREQ